MSGLLGGTGQGNSQKAAAKTSTLYASYRTTVAVEGLVIPILYGRNRVTPNVFKVFGFRYTTSKSSSSTGGKGGLFGSSKSSGGETYNYYTYACFGLCEGPIRKVGYTWIGNQIYNQFSTDHLMLGDRPQDITSINETDDPDHALGYYGLAFFYYEVDLGSGDSMPNHSFDVYGLLPTIITNDSEGGEYQIPGTAAGGGSSTTDTTVTEAYGLNQDPDYLWYIPVANADSFLSDGGVTLGGIAMTKVDSEPQLGEYALIGGIYYFNDQQGGDIEITYTYSDTETEPSTTTTYMVTVAAMANPTTSGNVWGADKGVVDADGNTWVGDGNTALSMHYSVSDGVYTFSSLDAGKTVYISYSYTSYLESNPAVFLYDLLTNPEYGAGFDSAKIGDLTQFSDYCLANNFLMSPLLDSQKEAREHIADILKLVNTQVIWSEDKLKFLPMGDIAATRSGVTFTPNLTPVLAFTEDDVLADGNNDPIQITRNPTADAYNQIQLEFLDSTAYWNTAIKTADDQADIDTPTAWDQYGNVTQRKGLRPLDVVQAHAITDGDTAAAVVNNMLRYTLYARNTYKFKLGLIANVLEPGDWITLTSPRLGLNAMMLRVTSISEDDKMTSTVECLEWPVGCAHAPLYASQGRTITETNLNQADAGSVN